MLVNETWETSELRRTETIASRNLDQTYKAFVY